jgi:hypothetical protein
VSSVGSLLGLEDGDSAAAPAAQAARKAGSREPRRRSASARASAPHRSTPTPTRGRRNAAATDGATSRQAGERSSPARKTRRDDLLALVREQPRVTLAQAAKRFGLKDATSLYSVARRLQDEGLIQKTGPALSPTGNAQKR